MKKSLFIFFLVLLYSTRGFSQDHNVDSCHFETPCNLVLLDDTSSHSLWQIGQPQKSFFDSAYSMPNALVTDTIAPYSTSNHSYFELKFPEGDYAGFVLSFRHKYQTDSLIDGGYIEISYDNGITWENVITDVWSLYSGNFYSIYDTLKGGIYGFSGTSNGWDTAEFKWLWVRPAKPAKWTSEEKILRFNFISDSIQTNKAGWMIDDIRFAYVDFPSGGSISEVNHPGIPIKMAPNPANNFISLSFEDDAARNHSLTIFNMLGQKMKEMGNIRDGKATLDVSGLSSGMYLVQLRAAGQIVGSSKFLKR